MLLIMSCKLPSRWGKRQKQKLPQIYCLFSLIRPVTEVVEICRNGWRSLAVWAEIPESSAFWINQHFSNHWDYFFSVITPSLVACCQPQNLQLGKIELLLRGGWVQNSKPQLLSMWMIQVNGSHVHLNN